MQASHLDKKFESPRWCGLFWGLSRLRHLGGRKEHKRLVFASLLSAKTLSRATVLYGGQVVFQGFSVYSGAGYFSCGGFSPIKSAHSDVSRCYDRERKQHVLGIGFFLCISSSSSSSSSVSFSSSPCSPSFPFFLLRLPLLHFLHPPLTPFTS